MIATLLKIGSVICITEGIILSTFLTGFAVYVLYSFWESWLAGSSKGIDSESANPSPTLSDNTTN